MDALRVTTALDLAGFQTGMPQAASMVETNTARMVRSFQGVQAASKTASQSVLYDWAGGNTLEPPNLSRFCCVLVFITSRLLLLALTPTTVEVFLPRGG